MTQIKVGTQIGTKQGNELKITEIYIEVSVIGSPVTKLKYDYKCKDGRTGTEENSIDTVLMMIAGD